jgi:hypothetical protein
MPFDNSLLIKTSLKRLAINHNIPEGPLGIIAEFAAPTPRYLGSIYPYDTLIKDIPVPYRVHSYYLLL